MISFARELQSLCNEDSSIVELESCKQSVLAVELRRSCAACAVDILVSLIEEQLKAMQGKINCHQLLKISLWYGQKTATESTPCTW
jgi:hypothetical protein